MPSTWPSCACLCTWLFSFRKFVKISAKTDPMDVFKLRARAPFSPGITFNITSKSSHFAFPCPGRRRSCLSCECLRISLQTNLFRACVHPLHLRFLVCRKARDTDRNVNVNKADGVTHSRRKFNLELLVKKTRILRSNRFI